MKSLVGVTPGGAFSFIKQLRTGHISDREIVRRRGFLHKSLHNRGPAFFWNQLNITPFLGSQGQMSPEEVLKTQTTPSLRVQVERDINKVTHFRIWDSVLPLNLSGVVNQMWTVCCILSVICRNLLSVSNDQLLVNIKFSWSLPVSYRPFKRSSSRMLRLFIVSCSISVCYWYVEVGEEYPP